MNRDARTHIADAIREAAAALYSDNHAASISHLDSAAEYVRRAIRELQDGDNDD